MPTKLEYRLNYKNRITVTPHALLRYIQRKYNFNFSPLRKEFKKTNKGYSELKFVNWLKNKSPYISKCEKEMVVIFVDNFNNKEQVELQWRMIDGDLKRVQLSLIDGLIFAHTKNVILTCWKAKKKKSPIVENENSNNIEQYYETD